MRKPQALVGRYAQDLLTIAVILTANLLMVSGQCNISTDAWMNELSENELALWKGRKNYDYLFARQCALCPPTFQGPFLVGVRENAVKSVRFAENTSATVDQEVVDGISTIDDLFTELRETLEECPARFNVTYNSSWGYPQDVYVDPSVAILDDEIQYQVKHVTCPTEWATSLAEQKTLWESKETYDYDYEFSRACFCAPTLRGPFLVEIRNGTLSSLTYSSSGDSVEQSIQDGYVQEYGVDKGIDGLFAFLENSLPDCPATFRVAYDETFGVPSFIYIDYEVALVHEEDSLRIHSFSLAPAIVDPPSTAPVVQDPPTLAPTEDLCNLTVMDQRKDDLFDYQYLVWEGKGNYDFRFVQTGMMDPDYGGPFFVRVRDDVVESVAFANSTNNETVPQEIQDGIKTINGLFDDLLEYIEACPVTFNVTYNASLGYPQDVFVDLDATTADDEIVYQVDQVACPGEWESSLVENQGLWEMNAIRDYQFEFFRGCFCPPDYTGPFLVQVRDGILSSLTYSTTGANVSSQVEDILFDLYGLDMGLDGLFGFLKNVLADCPADFRVLYNESFGFPQSASIDYNQFMADEEDYLTISDFVNGTDDPFVLDLPTLQPTLACDMVVMGQQKDLLFENQYQLWKGRQNYDYEFAQQGFIEPGYQGPFSVRVRDGDVESVTFANSTSNETVPQEVQDEIKSINELFDGLLNTIEACPASFNVTYNASWGYPQDVFIDVDAATADDEVVYQIDQVACPVEWQSLLVEGRALWESKAFKDYHFEFFRGCFCPPEYTGPFLVQVQDGLLSSLTYSTTGANVSSQIAELFLEVYGLETGMDGIFDFLESTVADCPSSFRALYNESFGFPESASLDYNLFIADEEVYLTISSFANGTRDPLVTDWPTMEPSQCASPTSDWKDELSRNLFLWKGRENYNFHFAQQGFVPPNHQGPFLVRVRDNAVESVNVTESTNETVPPMVQDQIKTINALFQDLEDAIDACPAEFNVTYNASWGYPQNVWIDPSSATVDEEVQFQVDQVACPPEWKAELDDMSALWAANAISDYSFRLTRFCECLPESAGPFFVEVRDGVLTSLKNATGDDVPTEIRDFLVEIYGLDTGMDGLFSFASGALTSCPSSFLASYNETIGFPKTVYIDYDSFIADEEDLLVVALFSRLSDENSTLSTTTTTTTAVETPPGTSAAAAVVPLTVFWLSLLVAVAGWTF